MKTKLQYGVVTAGMMLAVVLGTLTFYKAFFEPDIEACAGAVLHASEIIDGNDNSDMAVVQYETARDNCVREAGGL